VERYGEDVRWARLAAKIDEDIRLIDSLQRQAEEKYHLKK